jgi:UDP-N-acetylmuramoylalanine--D-glutamate ligase
VAITGTNGKSTTTELVAHLARTAGWQAEALGNVGRPFSQVADQMSEEALAVLEVSSFQLETIEHFQPRVSVVLNLAPDHLDRYVDQAAYFAAKQRLFQVTPLQGCCVTWTGCQEARHWARGRSTLLFGNRREGADVYLEGGRFWVPAGGRHQVLLTATEFPLSSAPNLLNALAAVAALLPFGIDREGLARGLRTFHGLPHRQQVVARLGRVQFVDDSKATNVAAVLAGLVGFSGDVVLIAGGRGKGEDYRPLRQAMEAVRSVVLIGEEGPRIAEAVAGAVPIRQVHSLEEAVVLAASLAAPRGTVLLSPACASFDMFSDFRARGEAFRQAALALGANEVGQDVQVAP